MTKEWLEQKAVFEARIQALEEEVAASRVNNPGIHIVNEAPSKIAIPGKNQAGGLKIVVNGLNHHQAMHALIQGMGWVHGNIMQIEAQMQAQLQAQSLPMEKVRLVQ